MLLTTDVALAAVAFGILFQALRNSIGDLLLASGANHNQPWRLVTTSRCSWSRDVSGIDWPAAVFFVAQNYFSRIRVVSQLLRALERTIRVI